MNLSKSQRILLETIFAHDGNWNWYKVGRACLSLLDSPSELTLKPLLDARYVEERSTNNEPLPRLHVTEAGKQALHSSVAT